MTVPGRAPGTAGHFRDHLPQVPYPDRGTGREGEVAAELLRLGPFGDVQKLIDAAGRFGLAGMPGHVSPDHVPPHRRGRC